MQEGYRRNMIYLLKYTMYDTILLPTEKKPLVGLCPALDFTGSRQAQGIRFSLENKLEQVV